MHCNTLLSCLATLTFLTTAAFAQGENHFINPPIPGADNVYVDNKNFSVGSSVNLRWTTNYPRISLILWQNDNASYYTLIDNQPATQSFRWPIDLTGVFDVRNGAVFFFQMWNMTNNGQDITDRFSSHYFNLVNDGTTPTDSATPTATGVVGTASSLPNAVAGSTLSSSPDSGLSAGAKAGIGIGVALGVLALIGAATACWFMGRRKSVRYAAANTRDGKYDMPMEQQHGHSVPSCNAYGGGSVYAQDVKAQRRGVGSGPAEMWAMQAAPVELSAESMQGPMELDSNTGRVRR